MSLIPRANVSKASAIATVHVGLIVESIVRAGYDPDPVERLEYLHDAQRKCFDLLTEINVAIANEIAACPAAIAKIIREAEGETP